MSQQGNQNKKKKQSIKELIKNEDIPIITAIKIVFTMILLIFGTSIAVFNSYITQSFAESYLFMNKLRNIFDNLLTNMVTYSILQTPELISNLFNIAMFNLFYTNLLFLSSSSTLSTLIGFPPSAGIIDVVIGYSLTIYTTFNLVQLKIKVSPLILKTIYLQILYLLFSLSGAAIIVGIMFNDIIIIAMGVLIIVLCLAYLALKLPIG